MSNFAMSALCRILTRGVYCGPSSCLSVPALRDFCSGVSGLDRAGSDSLRAARCYTFNVPVQILLITQDYMCERGLLH